MKRTTPLFLLPLLAAFLTACGFLTGRGSETKFLLNCRDGNVRIVQVLLERGHVKDINATDTVGNTALMLAAREGHLSIVRLLLERGADPRLLNKAGNTALTLAEAAKHTSIVRLLGEAKSTESSDSLFPSSRRHRYPAGLGPYRIAIADFNGDNKPDVVVGNGSSNDVTVYLGNGRGDFKQAEGSPFPAGKSPSDLTVGDFNKDGKLDLAVANHDADYVTILFGDGKGKLMRTEKSTVKVRSNPHPHTIAEGDLNEDGNPDVLVDSWMDDQIMFLFGNGDGTFKTPATYVTVPKVPYHNIRLADINRDRHLDIITPAMRTRGVTVLLGNGKGEFKAAPGSPFRTSDFPFFLGIGDVNGDGSPDIAIAHYSGHIQDRRSDAVSVLLGDGKGGFRGAEGSPFTAGWAPTSIAIGDVNGDGVADVAVGNLGSNDVTILLGGKKMILAPNSPFPAGREVSGLSLGDLNGDGKADLVVANASDNDITVMLSR